MNKRQMKMVFKKEKENQEMILQKMNDVELAKDAWR